MQTRYMTLAATTRYPEYRGVRLDVPNEGSAWVYDDGEFAGYVSRMGNWHANDAAGTPLGSAKTRVDAVRLVMAARRKQQRSRG